MSAQNVKTLKKGELLFKEGDQSTAMYLLSKGMIRIFKKKGDAVIEIDTLRPGQIIGEMAFLDGNPRSASGEAMMDCELIEISQAIYQSTMAQVPEWVKVLLKATAARLRSTTTKLKNLETASSAVEYTESGAKRNYVFLSPHDCLKIATALLLVTSRTKEEDGGKKIKVSSLERYGNQIIGIPYAKITSFLDGLKQAGVLIFKEDTGEAVIVDESLIEQYIHFVSDENLAPPEKRKDATMRAVVILNSLSKHVDRFERSTTTGLTTVNLADVLKKEMSEDGKAPFRMDEFEELIKLGYATPVTAVSGTEVTTLVNGDLIKKMAKIHKMVKVFDLMNDQKSQLTK